MPNEYQHTLMYTQADLDAAKRAAKAAERERWISACDAERDEFLERAANNDGSRQSDFGFGSVSSAERIKAASLSGEAANAIRRLEAEVKCLTIERDELLDALKLAWPIIEREKFRQECSYGSNFHQHRADHARVAYERAKNVFAKIGESV